jgi:ubiquinone/menaquinone biosynthesis C-methylase UbiE
MFSNVELYMFFEERIKSIKDTDRVLEIGPGATPYHRSDVFLELAYESVEERIAQSGHVGVLNTLKEIKYYNGDVFPFSDNEFDYIICSHVLEHVENADKFLSEIQRVAKKGYLEYPTIYYDFIYNFPEHKLFLMEKNGVINWMTKEESGLLKYNQIQSFFYRTCELGYHEMIDSLKEYFFQGFEWNNTIESRKVSLLTDVTYGVEKIEMIIRKKSLIIGKEEDYYNFISLKKFLIYRLKNVFK